MVRKLGFKQSALDHSVFYWKCDEEHTVVAMATDDMALTSKPVADIKKLKSEIRQHWEITDGGEMRWYLGFAIKWDWVAQTISINQHAYIEAMLNKFRLTNAKHMSTPMEAGAHFTKEQGPSTHTQAMRMWGVPYAEAIGCVLWPVMIMRPDCAFTIRILSQFIQNPGSIHWEVLKRVMVYLGSTKDLWLTFGGQSRKLVEGFCDSDYANQHDWHSIARFAYHFGQGAVTWSSKKQQIVALSTVEAEYIAQAHAAKEALWLHTFISEIRNEPSRAITINSDNQGAIALSKDNKFHLRTKHIDVWYHFICEAVEDGKVSVVYIPTDDNPVDIFTKPLAKAKFQRFVELLGLRAIDENVGSTKEREN
jgi:hypothetical protein